jgi:hypothetical protein
VPRKKLPDLGQGGSGSGGSTLRDSAFRLAAVLLGLPDFVAAVDPAMGKYRRKLHSQQVAARQLQTLP